MKRLFVVLLLLAAPAFARPWTDAGGKHHTTAELADFQGGIAYLKKDDGKISAVPLKKLSKADQDFIRSATPEVKLIEGKVISIADGDTLTVLVGETPTKIRLEGIDAPESHQAYGHKSREALADKVFHKTVRIEWRELDKYKRMLGHVFMDDRWVNKDMVQEGWAWHYRQYSKSEVLADAESDARTAQIGLWAGTDPIAPWEFRHLPKASPPVAKEPPQPKVEPPSKPAEETEETVYVTRTGEKYHRAGCHHLKSSIPMTLSEAAKRYSPCSVCRPPTPKHTATSDPPATSPSRSKASDRDALAEQSTGQTATGIPTYTGPRGGTYHYSKSGKKVYEKKK